MYTVIIVDDEKTIRDGLTHIVDWKALGYEIVATFGDGEEVIEYLNSMPVDVILTDIKMVHLSGIDIARYVQESGLLCKVVFLSGYREFELARQGMKYGVNDYVLKPSTMEEIQEIFIRIKNSLDDRKKDNEAMEQVKKQWEEARFFLEEKFINGLLMGMMGSKKDIEQRMQLLYPDINAEQCPCVIANLELVNYETFIQDKWSYGREQFEDALRYFLGMLGEKGVFRIIYKTGNRMKLFIILKRNGGNTGEMADFLTGQLKWLSEHFQEIFELEAKLEITSAYDNVFHVAEEQENVLGWEIWQEDAEIYMQEQKKLVISNIMSANINTSQNILLSMLKGMQGKDRSYSSNFLVELFAEISSFLSVHNPSLFSVVKPYIHYDSILNMNTEAEMIAYCGRVFDKMKTKESFASNFDKDSLIYRVKEYVRNHIFEDILLESVANELYLSTAHLSRVFKKQTGENFLQFVTKMKMEKAVELLHDPQYKVYQVSELLGYKTPRYFSKLFYSFAGYYPSQYRRQVLQMGDMTDEEV